LNARRPSSGLCAVCHEPIGLVSWIGADQSVDAQSGWKKVVRREYAHDWNGSIDSPRPVYHFAVFEVAA